MQRLFGETRLTFGGLALTALCLAVVGGPTSGWALYPVVGALAVGAGLAIPALTALLSRRAPAEQHGRLMGGVQAVLSLALISGPLVAGAAFDELGVPAPYFVGAVLSALALPADARRAGTRRDRKENLSGQGELPMTTTAPSSPTLRPGVVVLMVATAAIHLYLGLSSDLPLFVLNDLGYLTLLAALYGPIPRLLPYRNAVRWLLVGFTALTIILWLVITGGNSTTIGYVDKTVEVLLIVLLVAEARASR